MPMVLPIFQAGKDAPMYQPEEHEVSWHDHSFPVMKCCCVINITEFAKKSNLRGFVLSGMKRTTAQKRRKTQAAQITIDNLFIHLYQRDMICFIIPLAFDPWHCLQVMFRSKPLELGTMILSGISHTARTQQELSWST